MVWAWLGGDADGVGPVRGDADGVTPDTPEEFPF